MTKAERVVEASPPAVRREVTGAQAVELEKLKRSGRRNAKDLPPANQTENQS